MSEYETPKCQLVTECDTITTLQLARSALRQARESRATLTPSTQTVRTSPTGNLAGDLAPSSSYLDPSIMKFVEWPIESPEFTSLATRYLKEVIPAFCDWSTAEMEAYGTIIQELGAFIGDEAGIGKLAGAQTESEVEEITQEFLA